MDRRLGSTCTPGYFSRLGEAGTSAITIIDTEEESDSWGPSTPLRDSALFLLLDSPAALADHPPRFFPIFFAYFPGEEPIIPGCPESGCVCPAPITRAAIKSRFSSVERDLGSFDLDAPV